MNVRRAGQTLAVAAIAGVVGFGACSRPASYPDGDKVRAAQKSWCAALAAIAGEPDGWEHAGSCESAYPTASGSFLAALAVCFGEQAQQLGAESFEAERAIKDCTERALQEVDLRGVLELEVVTARCERMARCEQISDADCKMGFEGLAPSEQARLTRMYNQGALAEVASCLSSGCEDDEDAAKAECYTEVWSKRAWLPSE